MKVTYRWKDFVLMGMQMHDLIEFDNKLYWCDCHWFTDDVTAQRAEENPEKLYTLEQLRDKKAEHPNFQRMFDAAEMRHISCECGADKAKTPHSDWCPRYE